MGILGNILWFIFGGFLSGISWGLSGVLWCITIVGIPFGCLWCITIIGIPFGMQFFKIAKLSLAPFGAKVK